MTLARRRFSVWSAFAALVIIGWVGCQDFFVDPTLTSISVTPSNQNLQIGQTLQMRATGNFDDGSSKNVTGASTWSSSDSSLVSVNSTGLVTAINPTDTSGIAITAIHDGLSGSTMVMVGQSSQTITVNSNLGSTVSLSGNGGVGSPITFTATQNSTDVTTQSTWTSSNPSVITLSGTTTATSPMQGTLGGATGTTTVRAIVAGTSGFVVVTVNP